MPEQSEPIKIVLLSQYYYPDSAATGHLMTDLAEGLVKRGIDVMVYTGYPSYWGVKKDYNHSEYHNGVTIQRLFHFRTDTRTKIGAILHGLSFFTVALFQSLLKPEKRIYVIVTTPPFLPVLGWIVHKIRKIRYVIIIHDIDPDISIKVGFIKKGFLTNLWEKINVHVMEDAEQLVVLGECMAQIIQQKIPTYTDKINIIQNWTDESYIKPMTKPENSFAQRNELVNSFVILYSGNMGVNHNLEVIVDAAKRLASNSFSFVFIGEGVKKQQLVEKAEQFGLKNVRFFDYQPYELLPYTMTCSDTIIISQDKGLDGLCVSSKFYIALAAGRPIIALVGETTEIAQVIHNSSCGFVISDHNPEKIADRIIELKYHPELSKKMGENARKILETEFSREGAIDKYYKLLGDIHNWR
jgi:glycosyltransferase involved in cell wall biosynthesis